MKLSEFKAGEIIHRTQPVELGWRPPSFTFTQGPNHDYSHIERPVEFVDVESCLLFYRYVNDSIMGDKIFTLSLYRWDDGNWDYFPTKYLETKDHDGQEAAD